MLLIPQQSQQTSPWTGGTTTQLFIYPDGAEYAARDFEFRISTATVETETSVFTSLPGYSRILMILKGELTIHHEGHYSQKLLPYETDRFDGGWQTGAEGIVTDFNIIFRQNNHASLMVHELKAGDELTLSSKSNFSFGYLVSGKVILNGQTTVEPLDFVVFEFHETVTLLAETDCTWLTLKIGNQMH